MGVEKHKDSSSLAEVIDRILDKGMVIDICTTLSLLGIRLLSLDTRIVRASGIKKMHAFLC